MSRRCHQALGRLDLTLVVLLAYRHRLGFRPSGLPRSLLAPVVHSDGPVFSPCTLSTYLRPARESPGPYMLPTWNWSTRLTRDSVAGGVIRHRSRLYACLGQLQRRHLSSLLSLPLSTYLWAFDHGTGTPAVVRRWSPSRRFAWFSPLFS